MENHRLQITIPEKTFQKVKAAAENKGISISAYVNLAVADLLRKEQRQKKSAPSD